MTGARAWPLLRDALAVAAIAVLTFQALRRYGGDRYLVPSGSMQPVLYGDPQCGDIVFVDKLARAANCRRHDLVVVQHPTDPTQQLVKRIAASGDDPAACWIDIRDGDVWLGDSAQRLHRDTKDPLAARGMRAEWATWQPGQEAAWLEQRAATVDGGVLVVPPLDHGAAAARTTFANAAWQARRGEHAVPSGFVGTARAVDASYVDKNGGRGKGGEDVGVTDCGLELQFAAPCDELLAAIDWRAEVLTFDWQPATGKIALWRFGEDVATATLPPVSSGAHRVEFGLLDDRAFFVVDGRPDSLFVVPRSTEWGVGDRPGPRSSPRCHVYTAALGKAPLRLTGLTVFRDVFAWRERIAGMPGQPGEWPRFVPPGSWFLLGDNAFDSRDSRHFQAVPQSHFLGRPVAVIGPWARCRWLP